MGVFSDWRFCFSACRCGEIWEVTMCGIVGLLVKKPALREQLGELMLPMLIGMTERGPDSTGLAVFTASVADGRRKFSLYSAEGEFDWIAFERAPRQALGDDSGVSVQANHDALDTAAPPRQVTGWIRTAYPRLHVLSAGQFIDLYKDIGAPAEVATR